MYRKVIYAAVAALTLQIIGAARLMCPSDPNCVCGGTLAVELNCNIDGRSVKINLLPNIYINIKCENATSLDYSKLPKCANDMSSFKSVSFKDCPLPASSFKDVLTSMGVSKTMALIFQNAKNLSGYFDRKHFAGLQDLTKLLLSINGITHLPDNLFMDINKLTWLNIRSNTINLSEELFKPLEKLETLEISHNHMTNISSNLFSHLSFLRKLSLWQSNVTWFSKDLFTGVDVLEELDLSSNGLNELPASIFKPLKKLKKLTLFSNKFSSLPQNLFRNNAELETVVILNNDVKLRELPKYLFGDLPNLKEIYIQRSGLETVPYDVFANSPLITNISLAYNDLTSLPEAIFNDQINLLELDLSYNKLSELKPKLFSSLVRLERLKLCHNSLVEISGQTFSSLLSLIHLEMEHNNLKTISSYLFSNNKQRMSISLAYNRLDFEDKELTNNSWILKRSSPFAHTYNLKLLNISHNEFKVAFEDWWVNGHENLDIRYNYIQNLWTDEKALKSYRNEMKKPMKNVWISKNPLNCGCENYLFIDYLMEFTKTKIVDLRHVRCPLWAKEACYMRFTILVTLMTVVISLYTVILIVFIIYRKQINSIVKKKLNTFKPPTPKKNKTYRIHLDFCYQDEEFVNREILPVMNNTECLKSLMPSGKKEDNTAYYLGYKKSANYKRYIKDIKPQANIIIFSSNFLMQRYGHVDIKKIHSEMLKSENTVYVFADVGPENSIYAFLEEQRDTRKTLKWDEEHFWTKLLYMLKDCVEDPKKSNEIFIAPTESIETSNDKSVSTTSLPDWPNTYDPNTLTRSFHTLTHSQV
ncbi:hypothetical protein PYW07_016634 [Mythimna separata]|uniref:Uncharacterized protein n=1 Tax=Mythimna separata TaxID=271217 RepID=A0AAD7YLL6_MYTSE|nr:hypothetical protein PYW07_016634 [Mythimna separata]